MIHGRENEYATLQKWVQEPGIVVLHGGTGEGKSELVQALVRVRSGIYADLYAARHEGEALSILGEALGVLQENYTDPSVRGEAIRETLGEHEGIVVIDHATRVSEALVNHIDPGSLASIVIVSRRPISGVGRALEVGPIGLESGLEMARDYAGEELHPATLEAALKATGLTRDAVRWVSASQAIDKETASTLRDSEEESTIAAARWAWAKLSEESRRTLTRLSPLVGGFDARLARLLDAAEFEQLERAGWISETGTVSCFRVHSVVREHLVESDEEADRAAKSLFAHIEDTHGEVPSWVAHNLGWLGPAVAEEDPDLAWECLSRRCEILTRRGRQVATLEALDEAEGWPLGSASRARLHMERGKVLSDAFHLDREAAQDFSVARTLARSSGDEMVLLEAEIRLAAAMVRLGRGGRDELDKALDRAVSRDERRLEALATRHLAEFSTGEERADMLYQAARRYREAGAHLESSTTYRLAALAHFDFGQDDEVLKVLSRAQDQAERAESRDARRQVAWSMALAHAEAGDIEVGISLSQEVDSQTRGAFSRDRNARRVRALMFAAVARDEEAIEEAEILLDIARHRRDDDPLAEAVIGYVALLRGEWSKLRGALTRTQTSGTRLSHREILMISVLRALIATACREETILSELLRETSEIRSWGEHWAEIHGRLSELTESLAWARPEDLDITSARPGPTPRNLIDGLLSRVESLLEDVITSGAVLSIANDGTSFRVGRENVDVRRRRALPEILVALARRHPADEPFDVYELFDIGWPGEEIGAEQAAARVYNAIRTLRNLGLEDFLVTSSDGYMLDPTLSIERHD